MSIEKQIITSIYIFRIKIRSNFFYLFPWRKKKRISRKKIKESLRIYFLMTLSKLYSELCIYYETDKIYTDWWRFKRIYFYYRSIKIVKKSIFEYINFLSRVFLILKKDNFDQMQCPPRKIFSGIQENLLWIEIRIFRRLFKKYSFSMCIFISKN